MLYLSALCVHDKALYKSMFTFTFTLLAPSQFLNALKISAYHIISYSWKQQLPRGLECRQSRRCHLRGLVEHSCFCQLTLMPGETRLCSGPRVTCRECVTAVRQAGHGHSALSCSVSPACLLVTKSLISNALYHTCTVSQALHNGQLALLASDSKPEHLEIMREQHSRDVSLGYQRQTVSVLRQGVGGNINNE